MDKAHQVLRDTFGFKSFRLSQEAVIRRLVEEGESALVLYPTAGKHSVIWTRMYNVTIETSRWKEFDVPSSGTMPRGT